ncbi:MAG: 50S ribosomal protein L4 [Gammaproteobacteria bacterium]|nr:50S ribosomal protein L4 [Gammaproteobacteria bacterium]
MPIKLPVISVTEDAEASPKTISVSDRAFGVEFNEALVHQAVVAYQAGGRQGTRAQKNRSAVRGGGSKPWRQKGTGRARAGTLRSPLFRGGGRAFPASTRDFSHKVNRKMYRAAMRSILSELNRQDRLIVIPGLTMDEPKTKALNDVLKPIDAPRYLIVLSEADRNVELSSRNLPNVLVSNSQSLSPVSLISHEKVVMTADAIKAIDKVLQ